ncbi:hypothetical protein BU23DRAFT_574991 [Bimuria novae-zelandiae CBS 107.79]|uniref:Uncharacterized protein n=1 Tax=Bimuria novae-zelandiae CBS 107.79 TaxID=1447943 RepID=A0A6A5ULP5_9PLEO|nr:hypothetical protein BU23DRAFT_574991 [Bimuria novae-zelandiae CBS 107.79]
MRVGGCRTLIKNYSNVDGNSSPPPPLDLSKPYSRTGPPPNSILSPAKDDTYTDPLASAFQPTQKPCFADLEWPVWDQGIFDRDNRALDNAHELAFIAVTLYTRRAVNYDRLEPLSALLDKATLNFLGGWGINGVTLTRDEVLSEVEGDQELLLSFFSGVLYAIEKLRKTEVPQGVCEDNMRELVDAFEAHAHEHFVAMVHLVPGSGGGAKCGRSGWSSGGGCRAGQGRGADDTTGEDTADEVVVRFFEEGYEGRDTEEEEETELLLFLGEYNDEHAGEEVIEGTENGDRNGSDKDEDTN